MRAQVQVKGAREAVEARGPALAVDDLLGHPPAAVGDHHVPQRPERVRRVDGGFDVTFTGDVGARVHDLVAQLGGESLGTGVGEVCDHDRYTLTVQPAYDGLSEATRAAGHDCYRIGPTTC
jgi:hypothetical protein